ncbi:MAG TPA: hypothetical protein VJ761_21090 [Ktedonobacteraceae bacterium]|nr:hypothetical protein [Ktedonobacteraceae bacterium]
MYGRSAEHSPNHLIEPGYRWQHLRHVLAAILVPLLLAASSAAVLGLIVLVRIWTAGDTFSVRQLVLLLVVSLGFILSVATYTMATVFALRRIRAWHELNQSAKAYWATWGLGFTALVVPLPVLLAIFSTSSCAYKMYRA